MGGRGAAGRLASLTPFSGPLAGALTAVAGGAGNAKAQRRVERHDVPVPSPTSACPDQRHSGRCPTTISAKRGHLTASGIRLQFPESSPPAHRTREPGAARRRGEPANMDANSAPVRRRGPAAPQSGGSRLHVGPKAVNSSAHLKLLVPSTIDPDPDCRSGPPDTAVQMTVESLPRSQHPITFRFRRPCTAALYSRPYTPTPVPGPYTPAPGVLIEPRPGGAGRDAFGNDETAMIDLKDLRENPEKYRRGAELKSVKVDMDAILRLDEQRSPRSRNSRSSGPSRTRRASRSAS